jgi:hypothetical protein
MNRTIHAREQHLITAPKLETVQHYQDTEHDSTPKLRNARRAGDHSVQMPSLYILPSPGDRSLFLY